MILGRVQCKDVPSGSDFTLNAVYDLLSIGSSGGSVVGVVLDDEGVPRSVNVNPAGFDLVELDIVKQVIS